MLPRLLAFALLGAGAVAAAVHVVAVPDLQPYPCTGAPPRAAPDWLVVRGPQRGPAVAGYDEANRTTLVLPGCGHGDAGMAIRVRGDHRGLGASSALVLEPSGLTGGAAGVVTYSDDGQPQSVQVVAGDFAPVPWAKQAGALALAATLLPAGALLLRHAGAAWLAFLPAAGGLLGFVLGYLVQRAGIHEVTPLALPVLAVLGALHVSAGFLLLGGRPRPAHGAWGIACFAVVAGFLAASVSFAGAFPHAPTA